MPDSVFPGGNATVFLETLGKVTVRTTFLDPVNSLVTGDKSKDDWVNQIKADSDKLREALK